MPAVARNGGTDTVACTDGAEGTVCAPGNHNWNSPTTQATSAGSGTVFVNNVGVVRKGDVMASHPDGVPCVSSPVNHDPALSSYSGTVFANNLPIGRVGDKFDSDGHYDHTISSGSPNVFADS
jgi:uncharacterized Zn-binding protein involved in type VI secretion